VPGTPWIIASGMTAGSSLTLIDSRNGAYSGAQAQVKPDAAFANCATPPDAAKAISHGLNLRAGANGHSTLYAVGHGAREAIEVFDVDATGAQPALTWKGCIPMPDGLAANSVASFADGSLVATVLIMPGKTFADSVARRKTGAVYEWKPGSKGFELIRGSELPGNNGIEVSADGKEIFVVSSGFQTIVALLNVGIEGLSASSVSFIVLGSIASAMKPRGQVESFSSECCALGAPPHSGTSFFIPAVSRRPSSPMCTLSGVNGRGRVVRSSRVGFVCANATMV
jgi:hypothetical protein